MIILQRNLLVADSVDTSHPIVNVHAIPIADRQLDRRQCSHPIADIDRQRPIL